MIRVKPLAILLLIALCAPAVHAQSSSTAVTAEKPEFPQWVRDLRRAEIIAFGTFPFTMFISTFSMDTWRYFSHDNNLQYAPWPFKGAGAIEMETDEYKLVLGVAILSSITLALTDYLIVRIKRAKAERQRQALPEGELIILRKPWPPDEDTGVEEAPQDAAGDGEAAAGTP